MEPMSHMTFGTPFDMPEAELRRSTDKPAFDVVLEQTSLKDDPAMKLLSAMCYATEIRPWAVNPDPATDELAADIRRRLGDCQKMSDCLDVGLGWFEETYQKLSAGGAARP
jgi:hypothetical protein